jgi:hypothetical protein
MTLPDRFWAKVRRGDSCWEWTGSPTHYGYGVFCGLYVHRLTWADLIGPIPDGTLVLHRCDNRICVNPDHLFLGTHADNTKDMLSKGREARGSRLPQTRLSAEDVIAIRRLKGTMTQQAIALRFGVRQNTVSRILSGKRRPILN